MFPNLKTPFIVTGLLVFALLLAPTQAASAAAAVYVDEGTSDCPLATTYTATDDIQRAINEVPDGTTIYVCPGTYTTTTAWSVFNVTNRKNLKIVKFGAGDAVVQLSVNTAGSTEIILVQNSTNITLQGLIISGNDKITEDAATIRGINWRDSTGQITQNIIQNIAHDTPATSHGASEMVGIHVIDSNGDGKTSKVTISGNVVQEFEHKGIVVDGAVVATITGNKVTAETIDAGLYQAGISLNDGARATISKNIISDTPSGQGISIMASSKNTVSGNTLDNVNQAIALRSTCVPGAGLPISTTEKNKITKNVITNVHGTAIVIAASIDVGNTQCDPTANSNTMSGNTIAAASGGASTAIRVEVADHDGVGTGYTPSVQKTSITKNIITGFIVLVEDSGDNTSTSGNHK